MSLKSRLARLAARVPRGGPDGPEVPDWATEEVLMKMLRSIGADRLRESLEERPEWREALAPVVAVLEEEEEEKGRRPWAT